MGWGVGKRLALNAFESKQLTGKVYTTAFRAFLHRSKRRDNCWGQPTLSFFFPTKINISISLYVCFFNNCPFPSMLVLLTLIILKLLNIFFPIFVNMCSLFLCLYLSNLYKCPSFSFSLSRLYLSLYLSARLPVYTVKETFYQPKSIS